MFGDFLGSCENYRFYVKLLENLGCILFQHLVALIASKVDSLISLNADFCKASQDLHKNVYLKFTHYCIWINAKTSKLAIAFLLLT